MTSSPSLPPISELNAMDQSAFARAMASLIERAPSFVVRLAAGRPYASYEDLLRHAQDVAHQLPMEEQLELINSHPRIGARPAEVSSISYREQGYDRPRQTSDMDVQSALDRLNEAYERRFGFRFVIFVAGRPREAIVPLIEQRLGSERDEEMRRALDDVIAIARDRLRTLRPSEEIA